MEEVNVPANNQDLVAVVGGDSLLAREIRDLLSESSPPPRVQLISAAGDNTAVFSSEDDEAIVMTPLVAENLEGARVAFLAGSPASSRRAFKINPPDGPVLIDATAALEERPEARLRAPSAEASKPARSRIQVIAHPAAIALAMLLPRLGKIAPIQRSIVHVFEPASERGQRGLDELQKQTVAVLSFQKMQKDVFDAQLGFNLLARYGEEALEALELIEQRMERHLASLLANYPGIPMPSLRLIQAPVFHGHSFSVWIEFQDNPGASAISAALGGSGIDVRPSEPPNNVGVAGTSGLSVGAIVEDHNSPRACWLWMAADNIKLTAENAIAVAAEIA
ncbi:MAG TPA: Asd/ArgC dimerization domain-containing protein [Bryobacteraceae bacterium]|jgi:aspartate-semialdehyde dehydrogenase|nr:Asd/ArgC dimerization domain-containing protein [Bryobacteraceae bacterium]